MKTPISRKKIEDLGQEREKLSAILKKYKKGDLNDA